MSDIPSSVSSSGLWKALGTSEDLAHAVRQLRSIAEIVGSKVAETIPEFTDHSVAHMDALWSVADAVFTPAELGQFSVAEAFILGCTFYVHDLGMAIGATPEGRRQLEESQSYIATLQRLTESDKLDESRARCVALRISARELHAKNAESLIDCMVPGLDRFLMESKELRDKWGNFIGQVAASHHWSIHEVDGRLGLKGRVPAPNGGTIDLGFLACALRIIDYAHISAGRASPLERVLRSHVAEESLVHWLAQEHITGPVREGELLVFASMRPINDVDAWWVFYEMATGLDKEITAVFDYLFERKASDGRFSLQGVKGVKSPTAFAALVQPGGFAPVDVRFRPDSMTRLVQLLGGKQLYGADRFAAIRELLQNARDAIHLRREVETASGQEATRGIIEVKLESGTERSTLSVADDGVGMSAKTVTKYLLGIAADYWHSPDFYGDYAEQVHDRFRPVGRFGIGFLSVFMLGDDVEVGTQRTANENLLLRLRGVGRRGALERRSLSPRNGTTVRVTINPKRIGDFEGLAMIVQAKAPMLDVRMRVTERDSTITIEPGWWKAVSQEELTSFIAHREVIATTPVRSRAARRRVQVDQTVFLIEEGMRERALLRNVPRLDRWPGAQPELVSDQMRLLASPSLGQVVLCSKGFAIATIPMNGISGVADVGEVDLNAARTLPINFDVDAFRESALVQLWPKILAATDNLVAEGTIPSRFRFLHRLAGTYGENLLSETSLPWISILHAPGNSVLTSPSDFRARLSTLSEVFLTYNAGPWDSESWVRRLYPDAGTSALIVPVALGGGPEIRHTFSPSPATVDAPLADHFVDEFSTSRESQLENAHLLLATLKCISETWDIPVETFLQENWRRYKENLVGRLRRA